MDEKTRKLLHEYGVVILPGEIDHDTYAMMVEVTLLRKGQPVVLYCAGSGGQSMDSIAVASLIRDHGNFIGLLYGEAHSSHATIFAACQKRFAHIYAVVGVHMIAVNKIDTRFDSNYGRIMTANYEDAERRIADVFASASIESPSFWLDKMRQVSGESVEVGYDEICALGLAQPMELFLENRDWNESQKFANEGENISHDNGSGQVALVDRSVNP